jgi:hypothetical protein
LLLSRIDDFVSQEGRPGVDFHNSYAVYHRLVDQWLKRDAPKLHGLDTAAGWRVAVLLALHLTRAGVRKIGGDQLAGIPGLDDIPRFKLEARSLLNRNKDREFQFAHATIQEFLLAHAVLNPAPDFEVAGTGPLPRGVPLPDGCQALPRPGDRGPARRARRPSRSRRRTGSTNLRPGTGAPSARRVPHGLAAG